MYYVGPIIAKCTKELLPPGGSLRRYLATPQPRCRMSQHNLARAYQADGLVKEAIKLLEHVVATQRRTLSEDHPSRLASQHELARVYQVDGRVEEAIKLLEHVVAIRRRTLSKEHPDRLASEHNLARAYQAGGNPVFRPRMAATVTDLISTTITTLEAAIDHYNVVKDNKGLREAFHEAGRGLLLVGRALQTAKTQLDGRNLAGDPQSAMDSLKECNTNAELSKNIFNTVAQAPETSRFERYKEAVRQEGKGRTVEVLMMGMMNDVCALAENGAIRAGMEDQVNELRGAIEKLSKMEASVPKEGLGDTFTHYGSGDMLNAPGEKKLFCTTRENYQGRLQGFIYDDLPRTFQDAVRVTRLVGKKYVWIDALCIIQGPDGDWNSEARSMEDVFACAYCTIAASSARGWGDGFLKPNMDSYGIGMQGIPSTPNCACDFHKDVDAGALMKRAWVLQERVLSRRIIHFAATHTYWECGKGVRCEQFTKLEPPRGKQYFILDPNFPHRLTQSGYQRTVDFVKFLFKKYSTSGLTFESDRDVAIYSLTERMGHALRSEVRYGIVRCFLSSLLLWKRTKEDKTARINYGGRTVPSWSWMAYPGGIDFISDAKQSLMVPRSADLDLPDDDVTLTVKVRQFKDCRIGQDVFSRAAFAWTRKVGSLWFDVADRIGQDGNQFAIFARTAFALPRKVGSLWFDVAECTEFKHCVVVGMGDNGKKDPRKTYYFLLVRETQGRGGYERLGVGKVEARKRRANRVRRPCDAEARGRQRYTGSCSFRGMPVVMNHNPQGLKLANGASYTTLEVVLDKTHQGHRIDADIVLHFGPLAGMLLAAETTRGFRFVGMAPAAFAYTGYKVQARTLDRVRRSRRNATRSLYVQLSRSKSLDGIKLLSKARERDFVGNKVPDNMVAAEGRLERLSDAKIRNAELWDWSG
ncbi:hypothetical protein ACJZ2D_014653 [Fusarium nematophilum]